MAPLFFLLIFGQILLCTGVDTISSTTPLSGSQNIVSRGSKFILGFYSPSQSNTISSTSGNYYYIGIWYNTVALLTPVWTATADMLVSDPTTASLEIAKDGNLVLRDHAKNRHLWSTNVSISSNSTMAIIRDSGSLDLTDASNSSMVYWRSIDHPTDTWLPGGKLRINRITGVSNRLVSWKKSADPSPGLFSLELDPNGTAQFLIQWNESVNYWTGGSWNGKYFSHMPGTANNLYDFQFVNNATEAYLFYSMKDNPIVSRFIMDMTGQMKQLMWSDSLQAWFVLWAQPRAPCDVYALCGAYGSCTNTLNVSDTYCNCFKGFSQKVQSDWNLQDYSGGCKRNAPLFCQTNSSSARTQSDKFYVMTDVRLPDNARSLSSPSNPQTCEMGCLSSCSCTAYTYNLTGCFVWHGDLINLQLQEYSENGGGTLLLRLAASEPPDQQSKKTRITASVVGGVAAVLIILAIMSFFLFRKCRRDTTLWISENAGAAPTDFRYNDLLDDIRSIDSLLLDLSTLRVATNDFSEGNMLGEGGFGMVHKGVLPDGKQIAVKRLCQSSRQGIGELKSELVLVAKLRHRNLVSLIGVCLEEQEKILVYEFMPNRSLDTILFDSEKRKDLDWGWRFKIINGVARGLQYLHEDSQLKIVHRDLKASNILLDFDYNPKISDFGLAKIFGGDQSEDVTRRIAGTYGYMSPEYAMHGQYSAKSDAFSFGVLVLEIITGRRNNGSCNSEQHVYLVNLVWEHWTRGNVIELIDPCLSDHPSFHADQVMKCIQIGLLCVQNRHEDRPAMSSVNVMLSSQGARLPSVSMPAFSDGLHGRGDNNSKAASSNGMTITKIEPR
ncbi:putative serine/threonine-protein kinase receptor [Hordeum vulgare]|nr:putative serine/threonine-protein kinase receptor [Hordeum vulgare]